MSEFLLEILAEEIPAGVLPGAREDLLARVSGAFAEARLGGTLTVHSTSRRLILVGEGVADRQPDATLEVTGPPASRGFDADGKPTKAAEGFAKAQGVSVDDLRSSSSRRAPTSSRRRRCPDALRPRSSPSSCRRSSRR
jgi:glycyl-tRNA synthetase beta chain